MCGSGLSRAHLSDEDSALPVTFRAATRINLLENLRNEDAGQYWESRGHPDTLTVLKPHGLLLNHLKLKTHPYKHGYALSQRTGRACLNNVTVAVHIPGKYWPGACDTDDPL